jgi:hypothetical protein
LLERIPELKKFVSGPYELKSVLRLDDRFKSGRKLNVILSIPECDDRMETIEDIIERILAKASEPMSVIQIGNELKKMGRSVFIGTISPIMSRMLKKGTVVRTSSGYMLRKNIPSVFGEGNIDEKRFVDLAKEFLKKYPKGFLIDLLVREVDPKKDKWARMVDKKEIPFIIRYILEKNGIHVKGRKKAMVVVGDEDNAKGGVFSEIIEKYEKENRAIDVAEEARRFMMERGGLSPEENPERFEEIKEALYGKVMAEAIPTIKRRGEKK